MDKVKLFRIATAYSGKGVSYFAHKHGCSVQNIYQILNGTTRSAHIERDIDAHITESLTDLNIILNAWKRAA